MTILILIDDVFACETVLKSSLKILANKLINKTIFIFCKFVYTKVQIKKCLRFLSRRNSEREKLITLRNDVMYSGNI